MPPLQAGRPAIAALIASLPGLSSPRSEGHGHCVQSPLSDSWGGFSSSIDSPTLREGARLLPNAPPADASSAVYSAAGGLSPRLGAAYHSGARFVDWPGEAGLRILQLEEDLRQCQKELAAARAVGDAAALRKEEEGATSSGGDDTARLLALEAEAKENEQVAKAAISLAEALQLEAQKYRLEADNLRLQLEEVKDTLSTERRERELEAERLDALTREAAVQIPDHDIPSSSSLMPAPAEWTSQVENEVIVANRWNRSKRSQAAQAAPIPRVAERLPAATEVEGVDGSLSLRRRGEYQQQHQNQHRRHLPPPSPSDPRGQRRHLYGLAHGSMPGRGG